MKRELILILILTIIAIVVGTLTKERVKPETAQPSELGTIPQVTGYLDAVTAVKTNYPEFAGYTDTGDTLQTIRSEAGEEGRYLAFIHLGSGRPIIRASCFLVAHEGTVAKMGEYVPELDDYSLSVSPRDCSPVPR